VRPGTLVAVVGATAIGKSDLAIGLAERLGGEVVNVDSMQLYRGMDIGTAKLPAGERRGIPHHLLDIWDVTVTASVAEYQRHAEAAIGDIVARGKVPVLAGGSGLYVRAALGDLDFPGTDEAVRARLEEELAVTGPAPLHDRLTKADPDAAAAILPSNGRRIVRALEVIEITGKPYSATMPAYDVGRPAIQLGIRMPRPGLDQRIEARVDRMFALGLTEEVRGLAACHGLRDGKTASRALGYQQVLRYLDGDWTLEAAREETIRATRRFARRQESWFRRDPRVCWTEAGEDLLPRALSLLSQGGFAPLRPPGNTASLSRPGLDPAPRPGPAKPAGPGAARRMAPGRGRREGRSFLAPLRGFPGRPGLLAGARRAQPGPRAFVYLRGLRPPSPLKASFASSRLVLDPAVRGRPLARNSGHLRRRPRKPPELIP
jgi:tRNA dimethylallyltransferase